MWTGVPAHSAISSAVIPPKKRISTKRALRPSSRAKVFSVVQRQHDPVRSVRSQNAVRTRLHVGARLSSLGAPLARQNAQIRAATPKSVRDSATCATGLCQPKVGLMNQSSGLQREVTRFAPYVSFCDAVQFLVDQWNQLIERFPVAATNAGKKYGDRLRRRIPTTTQAAEFRRAIDKRDAGFVI